MRSFFTYWSYRDLLKDLILQRKQIDPSFTAQKLGESIGIQKSYLSKVLGAAAHLSSDQLYLLGKEVSWGEEEYYFVQLLFEFERSGVVDRQLKLKSEIEKIQKQHLKISSLMSKATAPTDLQVSAYYLDPLIQIVHMSLFIDKYSGDLKKLANDLSISSSRLSDCVEKLLSMNLVEMKKARVMGVVSDLHVAQSSPVYNSWISKVKTMSLNKTILERDGRDYNFAVFFTADEQTKLEIQNKFLRFLEESKSLVEGAAPESLYYMGFDFLPWVSEE